MVIWTIPAKHDLHQIHDFISRDSEIYSEKVIDEIIYSSRRIEQFPKSGRVVPEIADENTREIFVYSYRLIYEISGNDIYILAIIHGSRDMENLLK